MLKKSTLDFIKEARRSARTKHYSFFDLLHAYVYMRWPFLYIAIAKGDHLAVKKVEPVLSWFNQFHREDKSSPSSHKMAEGYHGKTVPLDTARQLVSIQKEINLENLEQVIPFERARDIILKNPQKIVALQCPCRIGKENPCLPLDVCLIIGDPFASFVLEHHPRVARAISQQEACLILEEEESRGHVHHAFFKDAMLNRFYAICNCCSCCCGAMQAQRNGTPMIISSGFTADLNQADCVNCGICQRVCQFGAIAPNGDHKVAITTDICMGCGLCVSCCPQGAISLYQDSSKPMPLLVESLLSSN